MLSCVMLVLSMGLAFADTGDTGSPVDTGSGGEDTSTADTSSTEPSSEETGSDVPDTGTIYSASFLAGEKGGFGCSTVGMSGALAFWISTLVLGLRREEH